MRMSSKEEHNLYNNVDQNKANWIRTWNETLILLIAFIFIVEVYKHNAEKQITSSKIKH
jgi:hypothetical protein